MADYNYRHSHVYVAFVKLAVFVRTRVQMFVPIPLRRSFR